MRSVSRLYATISSGKDLKGKGPLLTLEHSSTRSELRTFARGEFERNKFVHDLGHIRYLISTGKTQFDSMQRYIEQNAL
ncbi:hypothetical protein LTR78_005304 [Recurvomyces mirabilis]|uniref:Complex 1 LYR protein domain-containing protein n=1 Tax=Recurvomyces mirabilis TaxID=574656 RepID=A0AAE0WNC8_9PEZI|nr:hypothetical protein LTR78_005304 [Recurvomyces mirabilis]KAK5157854.1 hypothetical protein LTS14_003776 [Recurvomyces mirabilis]